LSARLVTFADGFTSASAPSIAGGVQEDYLIPNNTVGAAILTMDKTKNLTAFVEYELIRKTNLSYFKQEGSFIMAYDGTAWLLTEGNFQGHSMINVDGVVDPKDVQLVLDPSTGVLTANSGNIAGTDYEGTFKLDIVRIA
jgi:hypothetical protein